MVVEIIATALYVIGAILYGAKAVVQLEAPSTLKGWVWLVGICMIWPLFGLYNWIQMQGA